jgi:hypothetical protein
LKAFYVTAVCVLWALPLSTISVSGDTYQGIRKEDFLSRRVSGSLTLLLAGFFVVV